MAYGTILMLAVALIKGKQFAFILSTSYVTALIYLAVFGSIVAFGCYLTLIGRIGADRAAYATLLFPIVALLISTVWENYHWSHEAFIGVTLILFGNLLMVKKRKKIIRAELLT
jgi:drug/metabolite transporter (DMT)-like permease